MSGITLSHRGQRPREPVLPSGTLSDASQWGHRTFMLPFHRNSPEVENPRHSQVSHAPPDSLPLACSHFTRTPTPADPKSPMRAGLAGVGSFGLNSGIPADFLLAASLDGNALNVRKRLG